MKKLVDLLEVYTLKSIQKEFVKNPKMLEDFGYLIAENSIITNVQLQEIEYQQKYSGNLKDIFYLIITRIFFAKISIQEKSGEEGLFKETLVLKGKYRLRNIGNGEVEILTSSPYSKFGNAIRNLYKYEKNSIHLDEKMKDFSIKQFPEH